MMYWLGLSSRDTHLSERIENSKSFILLEGAHPWFDPQQHLSERGAGTPSAHNTKIATSISNDHALVMQTSQQTHLIYLLVGMAS